MTGMDDNERDLVEPEGVNADPSGGSGGDVVGPAASGVPAEESDPAPPDAAKDTATEAAADRAPGQELAEGEG
ncbi:MAG: hypothetical protein NVSMB13_09670 [Mycobacteriales bacterium]